MPAVFNYSIRKMYPYLQKTETVFVILLLISIFLSNSGRNSIMLVLLSLLGLGSLFMLNGFIDPQLTVGPAAGQATRLIRTLVRVVWISCSLVVIGIVFYLLGTILAVYLILPGGAGILAAVVTLAILYTRGEKSVRSLTPVLYRAMPALLAAGYLLFG